MHDFKVGDVVFFFQNLDLKREIIVEVTKTYALIGHMEILISIDNLYKTKLDALDKLTEKMFILYAELKGENMVSEFCKMIDEKVNENVD